MKLRTKNHSQNRQYNIVNQWNITIIDKNTKIIIRIDKYNTSGTWLVLWCLTPLLTILMEETEVHGENHRFVCRKSLTNFITYCCIENTSPWTGFELTTLVVIAIGTDCTGSCKSNYHTIATTTTPVLFVTGKMCLLFLECVYYSLNVDTIPWMLILFLECK